MQSIVQSIVQRLEEEDNYVPLKEQHRREQVNNFPVLNEMQNNNQNENNNGESRRREDERRENRRREEENRVREEMRSGENIENRGDQNPETKEVKEAVMDDLAVDIPATVEEYESIPCGQGSNNANKTMEDGEIMKSGQQMEEDDYYDVLDSTDSIIRGYGEKAGNEETEGILKLGDPLTKIPSRNDRRITQTERHVRMVIGRWIIHANEPSKKDMDEIQKVFNKNKKVIEDTKAEMETSNSINEDMLERVRFLTMRMRGGESGEGRGPVTSTPNKVGDKRGFNDIDDGGGGVAEKSPRCSNSPPGDLL